MPAPTVHGTTVPALTVHGTTVPALTVHGTTVHRADRLAVDRIEC